MLYLNKKKYKRFSWLVLLAIVLVSCNNSEKKEYKEYKDGVLYKSYSLDGNNNYDGVYKEFYKNGKLKTICDFKHGKTDSTLTYNEDSSLSHIVYEKGKDTFTIKKFKNNFIESIGESTAQAKNIGVWKYYNQKGKLIKKQEFINLCGKEYLNQSWEFDNGKMINDKGNHYKILLKKKEYFVGEPIQIAFFYTPILGNDSRNLIYLSPKILPDYCNIKKVHLEKWYSDNRKIVGTVTFKSKGIKNLRGYIQEFFYSKNKSKNEEYLSREVYFTVKIIVK